MDVLKSEQDQHETSILLFTSPKSCFRIPSYNFLRRMWTMPIYCICFVWMTSIYSSNLAFCSDLISNIWKWKWWIYYLQPSPVPIILAWWINSNVVDESINDVRNMFDLSWMSYNKWATKRCDAHVIIKSRARIILVWWLLLRWIITQMWLIWYRYRERSRCQWWRTSWWQVWVGFCFFVAIFLLIVYIFHFCGCH